MSTNDEADLAAILADVESDVNDLGISQLEMPALDAILASEDHGTVNNCENIVFNTLCRYRDDCQQQSSSQF